MNSVGMAAHGLRASRGRAARIVGSLALVVGSLCVGLALAELMLRVFDYPPAPRSGWRTMLRPDELGRSQWNQLGFRGRRIEYADGDVVVVLLGDSQVVADTHPMEAMPERCLERQLGVLRPDRRFRVFTVAAAGYGTDQEYLALQEYFRSYRADLVALWETPGNDVINNLFPTHWPWNHWPKPTFWLEQGALRGPVAPSGRRVPPYNVQSLLERIRPRDLDREWERLHLPEPYAPLVGYEGPVDRTWETGRYVRERVAEEKSHMAITLTPRSPRMQYGLDLTRALLRAVQDEAARHSAGMLAFHTSAAAEGEPIRKEFWGSPVDEAVYSQRGGLYRVSSRQYWDNVGEMNRGLPAVHVRVTAIDWKTSSEDIHLNPSANDQVMRDLAPHLIALLDRRKTAAVRP